jgi:hypothetical protein
MLHDYQGALQDLDKTNVLELNDAFTLTNHGSVNVVEGLSRNLGKP